MQVECGLEVGAVQEAVDGLEAPAADRQRDLAAVPVGRVGGEAGQDAAGIPVDVLIRPGVSINCVKPCAEDSQYLIHPNDLSGWENQYGRINPGSVVLIATGWDRFWHEEEHYFGPATQPRFPGIGSPAVRWLIEIGRASCRERV